MDLSKVVDNFLKSTLWLWLPFYAFFQLIHAAGDKFGKKR